MLKNVTNLNKKKFSINSILLINLVLAFFPISLILGSGIVNINIILFCALGIFHLRSKILTTKLNLPIKIIFLLFFVIFFSTTLSFIKSLYFEGYEYVHLTRLIKSIIFFRFFLLLVIIYLLSEFSILNFKYFFISAAFSSLLVTLDIIYQSIFGFNIIGLKSFGHSNTGFFGDELIAGGFIKNFSFFSMLFIVFIFKNKTNLKLILTVITICILGVGIIFSGNRMPLVLFLSGLLLVFLFNDELKKIIPVALICFFIIFKFIYSSNTLVQASYKSFYTHIQGLRIPEVMIPEDTLNKNTEINHEAEESSTLIKKKERLTFPFSGYVYMGPHARLFYTALDTWKRNKIFGNGIKSFRIDCDKLRGSATYPELGYNIGEEMILFKKKSFVLKSSAQLLFRNFN